LLHSPWECTRSSHRKSKNLKFPGGAWCLPQNQPVEDDWELNEEAALQREMEANEEEQDSEDSEVLRAFQPTETVIMGWAAIPCNTSSFSQSLVCFLFHSSLITLYIPHIVDHIVLCGCACVVWSCSRRDVHNPFSCGNNTTNHCSI